MYYKKPIRIIESDACIGKGPICIMKSGGTVWPTQAVSVQRNEWDRKFLMYYKRSNGHHHSPICIVKDYIYIS